MLLIVTYYERFFESFELFEAAVLAEACLCYLVVEENLCGVW